MCYCYASHGYVHLYYSYPDPPVNWTSVYDPASHCHVNKLIRYKIALCYCTTCYRSAFHGYVHLYNSYPDPPVNWTILFNLVVTSAHSTSLVTLGSYNLVNKSTCYSSTSHVYLYLYKSYLDPPLNRSIFFNLSATTAYCTYVYSRLRVLSADPNFFCHAEPVLLNHFLPIFKEPVWLSLLNFSLYAPQVPVFIWPYSRLLVLSADLTAFCHYFPSCTRPVINPSYCRIPLSNLNLFPNARSGFPGVSYYKLGSSILGSSSPYERVIFPLLLNFDFIPVPDMSGGAESEVEGEGTQNFSEEAADELLKSDTEEMDCEDASYSPSSPTLSDSFHSSKSHNDDSYSYGNKQFTVSRAYKAIRVARLADMSACHLSSSLSSPLDPAGALLDERDSRNFTCFMINSFETKRNISSSFDTASMVCVTCALKKNHVTLLKHHAKANPDYSSPVVFILADQSFPAYLPTGGEGECLRILRLEDGSLGDLTQVILDTLKNFVVPAGSVILIHSLSHLAWVGPAAYAEDLVRARQRICGTYRSGVTVIHGLPVPADGCGNSDLVNDLAAVADWINLAKNRAERDITSTRDIWRGMFSQVTNTTPAGCKPPAQPPAQTMPILTSVGSKPPALPNLVPPCSSSQPPALPVLQTVQPPATVISKSIRPPASDCISGLSGSPPAPLYCPPPAQGPFQQRLRMPTTLDSLKPATFIKEHFQGLTIVPLDEARERDIMSSLIKELNSKFNTGLDLNFSTSRETAGSSDNLATLPPPEKFILIGSSHLTRLTAALKGLGETVYSLASPQWRLTDENVQETARRLEEAVKLNPTATVIYQLYDSSVYFASSAPGEQALPRRGQDGKFHVIGELLLADWTAFRKIYYMSIPLLRAGGDNKKLILSPLPRYSTSRCCDDTSHISNFGKDGYGTTIGEALGDIQGWIDDFSRGKRIKNYEVICPAIMMLPSDKESKVMLARYWGADPVHLTPDGYDKLAEKLVDYINVSQTSKRPRTDSDDDHHNLRKRGDKHTRTAGISRSDTIAARWDGPANRKTDRSGKQFRK